jgi:hypothetical protein
VNRLLRIERLLPSEGFRIRSLRVGSKPGRNDDDSRKKISSIVDNGIQVLYL